ncbi:MAG: hypothetical protein HY957_05555 [Nitrospirae bacterium]|nr:hypothetical protein [Nitrospirota bacterium]
MAEFVGKGKGSLSKTKWTVLIHLHSRACQIGSEIVTLLKAGYADGAQARWRSLHEVAVVTAFIHAHDDLVAEQYLMHDEIEEYKSIGQQLDIDSSLGDDRNFSSYLHDLQIRKDGLIERYGKVFSEDYGWAACVLNNRRPTFKDIEKEVNLSHLRSYYREASHNVHAGVRGTFSRLGLHPSVADSLLLVGVSDFGLADPGHLSALSLTHATASILFEIADIDSVVFMKVILKQRDIVGREFWKCHRKMLTTIVQ